MDTNRDFAIIKIPGFALRAVALGNSNSVRVGESVFVVGSPRGLAGSVTTGIVSAIRPDIGGRASNVIQIDAAVSAGNSGGPVFNGRGEVIGVVVYKRSDGENLNFAIPINYVRGALGGTLRDMSLAEAKAQYGKVTPLEPAKLSPPPSAPAAPSIPTPVAGTWILEGTGPIRFVLTPTGTGFLLSQQFSPELSKHGPIFTGTFTRSNDALKFVGTLSGVLVFPSAQDGSIPKCGVSTNVIFELESSERMLGSIMPILNRNTYDPIACQFIRRESGGIALRFQR